MLIEASQVRDAYKVRRQMHQPNWRPDNKRWKPCWRKTAELLNREEIDLNRWMDAQFDLKAPFPMPNQLYSENARRRYETHQKRQVDPVDSVLTGLRVELRFLETRLSVGFELEEIMAMRGTPLTPLFCYCVAMQFGRGDLAKLFEESARKQLAATPAAGPIYRGLLPEEPNAAG